MYSISNSFTNRQMLNLSLIPRIVLFVFIGCCQVIIYPTWIRSSLQLLTCGDVEANPGPQYPGTNYIFLFEIVFAANINKLHGKLYLLYLIITKVLVSLRLVYCLLS